MKKKSDRNLAVIQNFILHLTHSSNPSDGIDDLFEVLQAFTPKTLNRVANEYIQEDHIDGLDAEQDEIPTFHAQSSFTHEDKEKEYEENIVVFTDRGENGTETIATIQGAENLNAIIGLLSDIEKITNE